VVVEGLYSSPLSAPASIETHVCLASFGSEGQLDVWTGVHMVSMYRKALADTLELDWRQITVHQPPIGGSFGGKIDIDPIDFITVLLAARARRPVRIHFSREEEFVGSRVRQPMHIRLKDSGAFAFAGLWLPGNRGGPPTATIVTTRPNELMATIHTRMPAILGLSDADLARWLDPALTDSDELLALLQPYPADLMEAYAVSSLVNSWENETPDVLTPAPELNPSLL